MPPTPRGETKSVAPTRLSAWAWVALRLGPAPPVLKRISDRLTVLVSPEASRALTVARSCPPRARRSICQPVVLSLKYRSPPPPAPTLSGPVVAILVRPTDRVVAMWHGLGDRQPAGIAPVPAPLTNALRP